MIFALIQDMIGSGGIKSYQVKNNLAYDLDENPYDPEFTPAAVNRHCYISTYNYPWLYEGGYFINWSEYKDDLPELDALIDGSNLIINTPETTGHWDVTIYLHQPPHPSAPEYLEWYYKGILSNCSCNLFILSINFFFIYS